MAAPQGLVTEIVGSAFGPGTATLDGATFPSIGLPPIGAGLAMFFDGNQQVIAPPINVASVVALTNPVTFNGLFVPPSASMPENLVAFAQATVVLERVGLPAFQCISPGDCWNFKSVTYDLSPVPEPTPLLLFGTTAAGLGVARWRQRRRKQQQP